MKKYITFLLYFLFSIVVFVLIFALANSSLGIKRIPAPKIIMGEIPVGAWTYKTNPILYYGINEIVSSGRPVDEYPFVYFYWYFLSAVITFIIYKARPHQFLTKLFSRKARK